MMTEFESFGHCSSTYILSPTFYNGIWNSEVEYELNLQFSAAVVGFIVRMFTLAH
jgi:hypothetical protein